jgi:hypothetical protein
VKHAHPMVEAVKAIMVHLIGATAMLNKGLGNYFRGCGCDYGHKQKLKTLGFYASLILKLSYQYAETSHTHSLWLEELYRPRSSVACRRQNLSSSML